MMKKEYPLEYFIEMCRRVVSTAGIKADVGIATVRG